VTGFATSIATVCLSGDLSEKLQAIKQAGFTGIEIFEQDFIGFDMNPAQTRKIITDHGLEVMLFQPFRDFEGLPKGPLRDNAFSRAKYKFETMNRLGCERILICSSVHPEAVGGIDRCADDFAALGEIAQTFGVKVGYEALAWGKYIFDHRDAWEIVRRANHPNIGLILDSYHTLVRGIDTESIRSIPGDKIFFVQLADVPDISMDYLYLSRHFRNMPGEGDLDIPRFMDAVIATGYTGPVSLEIFNDQFRRSDTLMIAKDGHRSLVNLIDQIISRNPDGPIDQILPPRIFIRGVGYIECAITEAKLDYYAAFLCAIGFRKIARHKSKQVIRFEQAGLNILLNYDPHYAGAETLQQAGLVVSEIALHVDDAASALARAVGLGARRLHHSAPKGEAEFPAIAGVNDSIIRLIDPDMSIWEDDFIALQCDGTVEAGQRLQHIDHIGQTMRYDQMLSWTLFYTSLFDLQKSAIADVVDPDGIIKSQVLSAEAGGLCLTLNGSDAVKTRASHFLEASPTSNVQHIAFFATDIFASAEAIESAGFSILSQTENYYDDIQAKFSLDTAFCNQLKQHHILYDEDDKGQFLHFYCHLEDTRLFFEFVQRQSGYSGFGAANAPYRLSAQRRIGQ